MSRSEHIAALRHFSTSVVSDSLDDMGYRERVMAPHIRPLYPSAKIVGVAVTIKLVEVDEVRPDYNYRGELLSIDALTADDVFVVSTVNGNYWGEYFSKASKQQGAAGIVMDAWTRDASAIIEAEFPTFAAAISPQDCIGRVEFDNANEPISCGGVIVTSGDYVVADYDGVVVVPADVVDEVIVRGNQKLEDEKLYARTVAEGKSLSALFLEELTASND